MVAVAWAGEKRRVDKVGKNCIRCVRFGLKDRQHWVATRYPDDVLCSFLRHNVYFLL